MAPLTLVCGRAYHAPSKQWRDLWHAPGICIGCDGIRNTRSAAAGLHLQSASFRKLSAEVLKIIFNFVDWDDVYEMNLRCHDVPYHVALHRKMQINAAKVRDQP